nr:MAG TPA: hypothetical protein [Caudoviricetes sp.]
MFAPVQTRSSDTKKYKIIFFVAIDIQKCLWYHMTIATKKINENSAAPY